MDVDLFPGHDFPDGAQQQQDPQASHKHSQHQHGLAEASQLLGDPEIEADGGKGRDAGEQHLEKGEGLFTVEIAGDAEQQRHRQNEQQ